jgi:hypothetical protein
MRHGLIAPGRGCISCPRVGRSVVETHGGQRQGVDASLAARPRLLVGRRQERVLRGRERQRGCSRFWWSGSFVCARRRAGRPGPCWARPPAAPPRSVRALPACCSFGRGPSWCTISRSPGREPLELPADSVGCLLLRRAEWLPGGFGAAHLLNPARSPAPAPPGVGIHQRTHLRHLRAPAGELGGHIQAMAARPEACHLEHG